MSRKGIIVDVPYPVPIPMEVPGDKLWWPFRHYWLKLENHPIDKPIKATELRFP